MISDYFGAAGRSVTREVEQGRRAFEAAKRAGVQHLIFMSVADAECFDDKTEHIKAKVPVGGGSLCFRTDLFDSSPLRVL